MTTKIYYITYDGLNNSVFESQVLELLRFLSSNVGVPTLIAFEKKLKTRREKEREEAIASYFNGETIILPKWPLLSKEFLKPPIFALQRVISRNPSKKSGTVMHCRGQLGSYVGLMAKKALFRPDLKVLADVRGLASDELLYSAKYAKLKDIVLLPVRYRAMRDIEKLIYSEAEFISCVSTALKNYLISHFKIPTWKIDVVPCSVDTSKFMYNVETREDMRQRLNVSRKIVFVYCGSTERWQRIDKVIEFFKIANSISGNVHLLLLINGDKRMVNNFLISSGLNMGNITIISAGHDDVPRFLMAGDVGLIIRDDNLLNAVSFPTKFGEYLSSGLFIISTGVVLDIANFIKSYNHTGYLLEYYPEFSVEEIKKILSFLFEGTMLNEKMRSARHELAKSELDIRGQYKKYQDFYNNLIRMPYQHSYTV